MVPGSVSSYLFYNVVLFWKSWASCLYLLVLCFVRVFLSLSLFTVSLLLLSPSVVSRVSRLERRDEDEEENLEGTKK